MWNSIAWRVALVTLACTAAACDDDGSRAYHGCPVYETDGLWDGQQLELVHNEPRECPIPIYAAGETVYSSGDIYDRRLVWRNAEHEVYKSTDHVTPIASDRETFRELASTSAAFASVFVSYPAATGRRVIGDFDYADFIATAGVSIAFLGLKHTTAQAQPLTVQMSGTRIPYANTVQSWNAAASGGAVPYRYRWYRDGALVAYDSVYSASVGTADFPLRVDVIDTYDRSSSRFMNVDVDGVDASINGPTLIYPDEGPDWTAGVAGGYPPYTYHWYEGDEWVGTGATYTGGSYPGGSTFALHVEVTDTRGSSAGSTRLIRVMGSETCEPIPPARTC